jgi:hypothetical protein
MSLAAGLEPTPPILLYIFCSLTGKFGLEAHWLSFCQKFDTETSVDASETKNQIFERKKRVRSRFESLPLTEKMQIALDLYRSLQAGFGMLSPQRRGRRFGLRRRSCVNFHHGRILPSQLTKRPLDSRSSSVIRAINPVALRSTPS